MQDTLKSVWTVCFFVLVLKLCQDEQKCVVRAATSQFGEDPCPSTSKYLLVAYQCKPSEFLSRVACEGENLSIQCKRSHRIAVYSASYGRSGGRQGDDQCPLPPGSISGECEVDCAMRTVMHVCHGKRRCRLEATRENFGDPCRAGIPPYLSVVYTCVQRRILREMKREDVYPYGFCGEETTTIGNKQPPGGDQNNGATDLQPEGGWNPGGSHVVEGGGEANVPPPATRDYNQITPVTYNPSQGTDSTNKTEVCITVVPGGTGESQSEEEGAIGFVGDWINMVHFIEVNKEKFVLYAVLSLCVGIILVLLVIIVRLVQTRRRVKREARMDITDPVPTSSPPPPDDFTSALLNGNHSHPQGDTSGEEAAEIISYSHNRGPPPFRSDTGTRSFNNYYG